MTNVIQHQTYGEIVFTEGFWSGKRTLTVNGVEAHALSKKEFTLNGVTFYIRGNFFMGYSLYVRGQTIQLSPKPTWYEVGLALIPIIFLLTWGNSAALCEIFPVVGGGIGGGIGGAAGILSLYYMKSKESPLHKVLIGLGIAAATIFVSFLLALALILVLA
jgi:hypothetical protein